MTKKCEEHLMQDQLNYFLEEFCTWYHNADLLKVMAIVAQMNDVALRPLLSNGKIKGM